MKYVQLKLGVLELGYISGSQTSWNKYVEWQLHWDLNRNGCGQCWHWVFVD